MTSGCVYFEINTEINTNRIRRKVEDEGSDPGIPGVAEIDVVEQRGRKVAGLGGGSAVLPVVGAEGSTRQPDERRAGSIDSGDELQDLGMADFGHQLRFLHPSLASHPASGGEE